MSNRVTQSLIVRRPAADLFRLWSNFENFPSFMANIKEVRNTGPRTSHWVMEGPLGFKAEWDAETTLFEADSRIGWSSKDMSPVTTSGQVSFKQLNDTETEVTVIMHYDPPAGIAGEVGAKLFGNLDQRVLEDLQNFKAYAEGMTDRTAGAKD